MLAWAVRRRKECIMRCYTKSLYRMAPIHEPDQVVRQDKVFGLSFAQTSSDAIPSPQEQRSFVKNLK
jgi:hypothetical protein